MSTNAQKTPFVKSLGAFGRLTTDEALNVHGKAIPATVVSVDANGTIVTVKFEVTDPTITFPQITCPVATDRYARAPLQEGDSGYVIPSDLYLGGVSGLGGGTATLDQPPNLSSSVFHPCGNTEFKPITDPEKYDISAPKGARISTDDDKYGIQVGPIIDPLFPLEGKKNALQVIGIQQAVNDIEAKIKGVPILGLYHNAGAIRVRLA